VKTGRNVPDFSKEGHGSKRVVLSMMTIIIMALKPFVAPLLLFQFPNPTHDHYDSLNGVTAS
jgi:hypothetical protein